LSLSASSRKLALHCGSTRVCGDGMFGWLKRRARIAVVNSLNADLERFLLSLRGAEPMEIGGVLALACHWRGKLEKHFGWNLDCPDLVIVSDTAGAMKVRQMIREAQEKEPTMAAGLMVWLHTLRATQTPEVRPKAREMWAQLERGLPYVEEAAETLQIVTGYALQTQGADRIPQNLRPTAEQLSQVAPH